MKGTNSSSLDNSLEVRGCNKREPDGVQKLLPLIPPIRLHGLRRSNEIQTFVSNGNEQVSGGFPSGLLRNTVRWPFSLLVEPNAPAYYITEHVRVRMESRSSSTPAMCRAFHASRLLVIIISQLNPPINLNTCNVPGAINRYLERLLHAWRPHA